MSDKGKSRSVAILDVCFPHEFAAGHIPGAIHIEAGRLPAEDFPAPKDHLTIVQCGHADRSTVGISLLEQRGYRNLALLEGGFSARNEAGYPGLGDEEHREGS